MTARTQSRLYNSSRTIQSTLLPLFELYSVEAGFAKLDAAVGSLRGFPKDLKLLQEQSVSKREDLVFKF